jgi:chromatin segregation and condensation protein Rec8/ScpA/Scc1 (kleisin family)
MQTKVKKQAAKNVAVKQATKVKTSKNVVTRVNNVVTENKKVSEVTFIDSFHNYSNKQQTRESRNYHKNVPPIGYWAGEN